MVSVLSSTCNGIPSDAIAGGVFSDDLPFGGRGFSRDTQMFHGNPNVLSLLFFMGVCFALSDTHADVYNATTHGILHALQTSLRGQQRDLNYKAVCWYHTGWL